MPEVYLTDDIKNVGRKGEIKRVRPGHFRNMLLPRQLALLATEELKKVSATQMQRRKKSLAEAAKNATEFKKKLEGVTVTFARKATSKKKIYAAISVVDIAKALRKEHGVTIPEEHIRCKTPIKAVGKFSVTVECAPGVAAEITVQVEAQ